MKSVAHEQIGLLSGDASSELQTLLKDRDIETTNRISRELRCSEKVLTTGDTVYVFGEAKRVDEKLVICSRAPKYRKKGQTNREWRMERDKSRAEGMPLIVTDDGERKVEEGYFKSARGWMIATIILVVITLAFIVAGILFVAGILPVNARSGNDPNFISKGGVWAEDSKAPVGDLSKTVATAKAAPAKTPDAATVKKHMTPAQLALGDPVVNSIGMLLVPIPAGEFQMGEGGEAHKVTLTKPFELGVYEVTQEQYEQVMGSKPSKFKGPQNPVKGVRWNDAVEFCRKLSQLSEEKAAGYVYRLPTEAEWEYACRAGTTTKYSFGDSESELGEYAWYRANSGNTTHPAGGRKPNAWGLYDMHGNVKEWCQDWYEDYPSGPVTDPTGAASGSRRVLRGGSFFVQSSYVRSATRNNRYVSTGFRPARTYNLSR